MITLQSIVDEVGEARGTVTARLTKVFGGVPDIITADFKEKAIQEFKDNPVYKQGKLDESKYIEAYEKMIKDGYITTTYTRKHLGTTNDAVLTNFDKMKLYVYEDIEKVRRKGYPEGSTSPNAYSTRILIKAFNPTRDKWRQEAKYDNGYITEYNNHRLQNRKAL